MLQPRIESERTPAVLTAPLDGPGYVAALLPEGELETPPLPRDLPQWAKDAVAISRRARQLLARLKPIVVRVLTFWDHRVRSIGIAGRKLSIDPSGSYRAD